MYNTHCLDFPLEACFRFVTLIKSQTRGGSVSGAISEAAGRPGVASPVNLMLMDGLGP